MEYPHKEFTYRGVKVVINCFVDNTNTKILDFGAEFYQNEERLVVVSNGWNCLIRGNINDCIKDSKLFIDARLDKQISKIDEWEDSLS